MFGCGVELDPETVPETRAVRAGSMLSRNRDNIPDTGGRILMLHGHAHIRRLWESVSLMADERVRGKSRKCDRQSWILVRRQSQRGGATVLYRMTRRSTFGSTDVDGSSSR